MSHSTDWWPGIIVLFAGMLFAAAFLLALRKRAAKSQPDDRLADLDGRAQLLLDQLKELNADRHHHDELQYTAERARLETQAANALRERAEHERGHPPATAEGRAPGVATGVQRAPAAQGWWSTHPQLKGAAWGGGVVLFFVALGLLLGQEQKPRVQGAEATGRDPRSSAEAEPKEQEDPALKEAFAQLQAHPDDVEALAQVSHQLINRQEWDEARRLTERALGLDPFHVENRIHRAVLAAAQGDEAGAVKALEHLTKNYPDAHEGLLFLGGLAMQAHDSQRALEHWERYAAEAPATEQPPRLREAITLLRSQLGLPR